MLSQAMEYLQFELKQKNTVRKIHVNNFDLSNRKRLNSERIKQWP